MTSQEPKRSQNSRWSAGEAKPDRMRRCLAAGVPGCMVVVLSILIILISTSVAQEPETKPATKTPATKSTPAKPAKPESASKTDQDWPLFRGNKASTGVATSKLPKDLDVLWEYKVRDGGFEGTPIVVRNQTNGRPTVYVGDMDGVLISLDLETGKENWKHDTGLGFTASPAYHDGHIFIGDIDGFFWCFTETGEVKWKFEVGIEISGAANFFEEGVLFGAQDAKLYLLNRKDGSKIWEFETPDQIQCSTTVAKGMGFVAGCDAYLHLIDLKKGTEVGKVEIHSPTQSTPAVAEGKIVFGTEQADFFAIDLDEVKLSWSFAGDNGAAAVRGSAAINNGHVVFGARNRRVYSVDAKTGKQQWSTVLKANVDASPVIVGDRVFVGSTDGRMYALSLEDGAKQWTKEFQGGFLSSPAVAFDRLVVATDRGVVYCLGEAKSKLP